MTLKDLIPSLHKQGLGILFVLYLTKDKVFFGHVMFEKGKLVIKDKMLLADMKPEQLRPCWDSGYVGLLCHSSNHPWESLTFYGLEQCDFPADLSQTRHGALIAAENQYGDKLIDFTGSVYRGFQLMLDNHFLPVVLLKQAQSTAGEAGLIISDLRSVPMPISLIRLINDEVRKSIEQYLILEVDDVDIDEEEFGQLFGDYLQK